MSYVTLLPIFADWYFKTGSAGYGLLNAAHGAGSLTGTLVLATVSHRIGRPGTALLIGAACLGFSLTVFSRSHAMWLASLMLVLVGFSGTFYLTQVTTLLQQEVPDRLRGRVLGLYSLCWNLLPLGGLLAGVLAAAVDARFAVLVGGVMVTLSALLLLTSRRLRAIARSPAVLH
jgi:MFS family permease